MTTTVTGTTPSTGQADRPILVIPDIHNRTMWAEGLCAKYPEHLKVFLGDYFDNYGDSPEDASRTAKWLKLSLSQQNRIHLLGNHDLPYVFPSRHTMCPGWTNEKHRAVEKILTISDWSRCKAFHRVKRPEGQNDILLSHAGFTVANAFGIPDSRDVASNGRLKHLREFSPEEYMAHLSQNAHACLIELYHGGYHPWMEQGWRMGKPEAAGPFWVDINHLHPMLPGFDQIVGHSQVMSPLRQHVPNATNPLRTTHFIDGAGKYAAIIDENGIAPIWTLGTLAGQPMKMEASLDSEL